MSAKVDSVQNTNTWAKAAVMIRQSLAGGSKYALLMQAPDKKLQFQWRTADNQSVGSGQQANVSSTAAYQYLKLTRSGNSFSAYHSANGTSWTQIGSAQTIDMGTGPIYAGLAVCSHVNDTLCTAQFSNVSWPGSGTCTPTTCAALGATCGTPSDGCGGTLSCGTCGTGSTCNASHTCEASGGNPCADLCSNPIVMSSTSIYGRPLLRVCRHQERGQLRQVLVHPSLLCQRGRPRHRERPVQPTCDA